MLLLAALVLPRVGAYEGGDVVGVLDPLALVLGALLGGLVGAAVHHFVRDRPQPKKTSASA